MRREWRERSWDRQAAEVRNPRAFREQRQGSEVSNMTCANCGKENKQQGDKWVCECDKATPPAPGFMEAVYSRLTGYVVDFRERALAAGAITALHTQAVEKAVKPWREALRKVMAGIDCPVNCPTHGDCIGDDCPNSGNGGCWTEVAEESARSLLGGAS